MPILITKHCRSKSDSADGHRLLVTRYWPRGVKKEAFDEWRRELAPSKELLRTYRQATAIERGGELGQQADAWAVFTGRYRSEIAQERASVEELQQRHGRGETLSLLCACHAAVCCHRSILAQILMAGETGKK